MPESADTPSLLRPVQHAFALSEWLRKTTIYDGPLAAWMGMVAGLSSLSVDDPDDMCAGDPGLENAFFEGREAVQMAGTRLLYAASALHSALHLVDDGQTDGEPFDERLVAALVGSAEQPFAHSRTVLDRLRSTAAGRKATAGGEGVAVAIAGVQFWRGFMRAGFEIPNVESEGDSYRPGGGDLVDSTEAATTCLLMTIQRLLLVATDRGTLAFFEETFDPSGEPFWIIQTGGEGQWVEAPAMRDVLPALHLDVA
jgi:hypothetical protein